MPERERQERRLRTLLLAVGATAVTVAITLSVAWAGYLPWRHAGTYLVLALGGAAVFFVLFKTGLNNRFADPALTWPQMAVAGVVISYGAYHGPDARAAFMIMYLLAFQFGVFALSARGLAWLAAFFFACYAAVAGLSLAWLPEITYGRREAFRLVALGLVLGWFTLVGAYIGKLRDRLRGSLLELKDALARAEALASRDPLTGCYNRRTMRELLELEAKRAQRGTPLTLCMADLDHFKSVNDTYGHAAGDEVLKGFADEVRAIVRPTDALARWGGEEFLIGFSQTGLDTAAGVAERLRMSLEQRSFGGLPQKFRVTGSFGMAEHRAGETIEQTLARADAALYEAKREGRNRVRLAPAGAA
jgi:diguanylate cyclase (GGDEF)-like protein